jgi:hypothetical protein
MSLKVQSVGLRAAVIGPELNVIAIAVRHQLSQALIQTIQAPVTTKTIVHKFLGQPNGHG